MSSDQSTSAKRNPSGESAGVVETVRQLLNESSRLSALWKGGMLVLVILSTVDVTRDFEGDVAVHFQVTSVTALIIALVWLPALVRAITLTGGELKTPAGEASARGILETLATANPEIGRAALSSLAAGLNSAETAAGTRQKRGEARAMRRDVELTLQDVIKPPGSPDETLEEYGRKYEELRSTMHPDTERTFLMSSLMAEVRAVAGNMRVTPEIVKSRLASGKEGDRVVALTLLEAVPLRECFEEILDGIGNSRSAFEQFQALRAAEEILSQLDSGERARLAECLEAELLKPEKGIDEDSSRRLPIERMLAHIEAHED